MKSRENYTIAILLSPYGSVEMGKQMPQYFFLQKDLFADELNRGK